MSTSSSPSRPDTSYRIMMNGVTGRMGYRQHLVRSILAIREEGGVLLPGRHPRPGRAGAASAATRTSSRGSPTSTASRDWTTDLDAALADATRQIYFDAQVTTAREKAILTAIAAGKHVYTEKPIAETRRRGPSSSPRPRSGRRQERRRARQALPARAAQAQAPRRRRLLRPDPLGARRVRLLGLRGRLAARAAPELELPRRRTAAASSSTCSATGTTCWRTSSAPSRRSPPRRSRTSPSGGTSRASRTTPPPTTRPTRIFELDGGSRRADQLLLGGARPPRRARRVPGRRHPRQRGRRAARCRIQHRAATPKPVWNPDLPDRPSDFREQWQRGARQRRTSTTASRPSGSSSSATSSPGARTATTSRPAPAGCELAEAGAAVVGRGPPRRVPR